MVAPSIVEVLSCVDASPSLKQIRFSFSSSKSGRITERAEQGEGEREGAEFRFHFLTEKRERKKKKFGVSIFVMISV